MFKVSEVPAPPPQTNHIVGEWITHHFEDAILRCAHFFHEHRSFERRAVSDAFLHDVRGVFVARERNNVATNRLDDRRLVFRKAMLQDVLDNVVAILVLSKVERVGVNLLQDRDGLLEFAILEQTLNDATRVTVRA